MADKSLKKRGLGRGLSALMADVTEDSRPNSDAPKRPDLMAPIEKVSPNPEQPRRSFDKEQLQDLAASIAEKGIIQPIIVRPNPKNPDAYEIVAGERRWRAAQIAKLHEVPVIVRSFDDIEVLEVAIIENIQRADLNPVEEAAGYNQLMHKFGHTQEKLAEVLGKSRSHIANSVRLLQLPDEVQTYLREGKLSAGHARALITSDDPAALARRVIQKNLSVRETEKLAKSGLGGGTANGAKRPASQMGQEKDADTKALEGDLSANLGMKVIVDHKAGHENGQITIKYQSLDQLDDLCRILSSNS
ncbi:Chromosome-partitioning protein ParB [Roseovarius litorisediminis]|uniref:Chromosome-partitioning protein ParB n=2 Tax=Roseovarius litorisediminis TaxID=1312363 RepID=A0A1Y5SLK6_9RHOB|nr:ParB/RepB/Spo0J family partition protein [Roseovarius litorisediminis]SLN43430.1 Chromosome-partitioning protein ParB [Roseovarius litorisediminis]